MSRPVLVSYCFVFTSALVLLSSFLPLHAAGSANMKTLTPGELLQTLQAKKGSKPLLFYVGPRMLYVQAHIYGSEFIGQCATAEGVQKLREHAASLPRKTAIVLYCGCCPWSHCPNINPAYDTLTQMGFTNVKALYLMNNFGADWVDKGYPTARGEQ